jgi:alanyl-tRNA synthetase
VGRTGAEIRKQFIDFFKDKHAHTFVPSSPVVPHDDPTLLFTNAGMNQFKDVFLGTGTRNYTRAANTQKCIRAGGKHNDLDDVGKDTYHHTFFEMLGNWSFGDYFKAEAVDWAWELLTEVWGIDKERLHATYFEGAPDDGVEPDYEACDLWGKYLPKERIHPGNKKDNFWEMGETGPCGPCSEIHIDLSEMNDCGDLVNADDARVIEIWNLVFIQFNRGPDGKLTPLPAKHVDTGMGFERIAAVLQHKTSNYDSDIWSPLFDEIRRVSGAAPYGGALPDQKGAAEADILRDTSYRVIADHVRCLTFALTDGAVPDKEGRGYVLRRILRRGVRYGWQYFDLHEPFLHKLVPTVVETMGEAFPELKKNPQNVIDIIKDEEESFGRTLDRGIALFNEAAQGGMGGGKISGADAFKLHDTYGFPIDLTQIMAEEKQLSIDLPEYERLMEEAREKARAGGGGANIAADIPAELVTQFGETDDSFKYTGETHSAKVLGIIEIDETRSKLAEGSVAAGQQVGIVTNETCFYAEQGGQVGDIGVIKFPAGEAHITDTQRFADTVIHIGRVEHGELAADQPVELCVDHRRSPIKSNHTATHVMNFALREVLGDHVQQKGSLVDDEKTRFDFSHPKALTNEEVARVEQIVDEQIKAGLAVNFDYVPQEEALKINGLRAVFGEKYPAIVRVMSIGPSVDELRANPDNPEWARYSIEFCGGTHCRNTSEIEKFALVAEESVAKGIRRLVGVSGQAARKAIEAGAALLTKAAQLKQSPPEDLSKATADLQQQMSETTLSLTQRHALRGVISELQKLAKQQQKEAAAGAKDVAIAEGLKLADAGETIGETRLCIGSMPDVPTEQLKQAADAVKQKYSSALVLFGAASGGKVMLVAACSPDLIKRGIKAGDLVKHCAAIVGGGGGGAPHMAQAGGKDARKLPDAIEAAKTWAQEKLA